MINAIPAVAVPPEPVAAGSPDSEVIRRSRQQPEQFALLFQRHAPALGRYVTRRLGPDLAQDVVAETFLAAFRQRAGYDLTRPDARPRLHGIAAILIRRYYRDEERKLRALERTGIDPVMASAADHVEAALAADATSRAVAAAIAGRHGRDRADQEGQILGWTAMLRSAIVRHAGQLP